MKRGDMVKIVEEPWNMFAGQCVIITKIDEDGRGFDFVIPEERGHSPVRLIEKILGNFDLEKLGVK